MIFAGLARLESIQINRPYFSTGFKTNHIYGLPSMDHSPAKIIDLFAYQMAKEKIHPAKLTAKQIAFRHEYYAKKWEEFEGDQAEIDKMADWISDQFEALYHEPES